MEGLFRKNFCFCTQITNVIGPFFLSWRKKFIFLLTIPPIECILRHMKRRWCLRGIPLAISVFSFLLLLSDKKCCCGPIPLRPFRALGNGGQPPIRHWNNERKIYYGNSYRLFRKSCLWRQGYERNASGRCLPVSKKDHWLRSSSESGCF